MTLEKRSQFAIKTVFALVVFYSAAKIVVGMGLFADGSYFLLNALIDQRPFVANSHRLSVYWITQLPLLLALKAGLKEMNSIVLFFSFCLIAIPVGVWLAALWRLRDSLWFWSIVMLFSVSYLNSDLFISGESLLTSALAVLAFSILLKDSSLKKWELLLLTFISVSSIWAYESFVFFGPLLAFVIYSRRSATRADSKFHQERIWLWTSVFVFSVATFTSIWQILFPASPIARSHASDIFQHLRNKQFALSTLTAALYGLQLFSSTTTNQKKFKFLNLAFMAAGFLSLIFICLPKNWASMAQHFGSRSICSALLFFGLALISFFQFYGRNNTGAIRSSLEAKKSSSTLATLPSVLLIVLLSVNSMKIIGFYNFTRVFQNHVNSRSGFIPAESTPMWNDSLRPYAWWWTNPTLSFLLRTNAQGAIIVNPLDNSFEPYDIHTQQPDLSKYKPGLLWSF